MRAVALGGDIFFLFGRPDIREPRGTYCLRQHPAAAQIDAGPTRRSFRERAVVGTRPRLGVGLISQRRQQPRLPFVLIDRYIDSGCPYVCMYVDYACRRTPRPLDPVLILRLTDGIEPFDGKRLETSLARASNSWSEPSVK